MVPNGHDHSPNSANQHTWRADQGGDEEEGSTGAIVHAME
jgi:hypothetical protein